MTNPVCQLRSVNDHGRHYQALMFICPGCVMKRDKSTGLHMLPVSGDVPENQPRWDFDGNMEQPTLSPSILTKTSTNFICHSFLQAGVFQFLPDSTHAFSGQQVPIPPLPDWVMDKPKKRRKK